MSARIDHQLGSFLNQIQQVKKVIQIPPSHFRRPGGKKKVSLKIKVLHSYPKNNVWENIPKQK